MDKVGAAFDGQVAQLSEQLPIADVGGGNIEFEL
jgi:hypothetical protein